MIHVDVENDLQKITKQLDGVWYKAPSVLKDAANATGKYAMRRMTRASEKRYDYREDETRLSEHLKRKSASYANPYSIITVNGKMNALTKFHVSPMTLAHGRSRPGIYAAHVLGGKSNKALEGDNNFSKAFVVKFSSGHIAAVQRQTGSGKIVEKKTVSPMHMASKVYDLEQDAIGAKLQQYTQKYIDKFMKERELI